MLARQLLHAALLLPIAATPLVPPAALTMADVQPDHAGGQAESAPSSFDSGFALRPDFNGDGYADLVASVPRESLDGGGEGAVSVIYGSANGLSADGNQLWSQDSSGVLGESGYSDSFGASLAWSDFDGDGHDDLAVGVPFDPVGSTSTAGAVNVLYGSPAGLTADGNQLWTRDSPGVPGRARQSAGFGGALLGRDFDRDGFGDLVIGEPHGGSPKRAGAAVVLYGDSGGLDAARTQELAQLKGRPEKDDHFGSAFATGDFDNNGYPDLAIGVPEEDIERSGAGAVNVVYGSASGFVEAGNQFWREASPGVPGEPSRNEHFGFSLTVGDFDGDTFSDLAIGILYDDVGEEDSAGSALVIYGGDSGLSAAGSQLWNRASPDVLGEAAEEDNVTDVSAGDFDDDGFADLAVGYPGVFFGKGSVNVLYGTASGLSAARNQEWNQGTAGVEGDPLDADQFGYSVSRADFDGDGYFDLAVGVSWDWLPAGSMAGSVNVLYGAAGGLTTVGNQLWNQDSPGILDQAEGEDRFGTVLNDR